MAQQLPYDTSDPKIDVTLPIGQHTLELVVEDSAGLRSDPDHVIITVEHVPEPSVNHVVPDEGLRGKHLQAEIHGENLLNATAVRVFHGSAEDDRVVVKIQSGGTAEELPIQIEIAPFAELGTRIFEVITPHGSATGEFVVMSNVEPEVLAISPKRGVLGLSNPTPVRIEGDSLDSATDVAFYRAGSIDPRIKVSIRKAHPEFLSTDVSISANAVFGKRTFLVTTPAGQTESPAGETLSVVPGAIQIGVILTTIVAALMRIFLMDFPNTMVILSGVIYLLFLAALYLPNQTLADARRWWRLGYITVILVVMLTTYAVAVGQGWQAIDSITFGFELLLLVFLYLESRQPV